MQEEGGREERERSAHRDGVGARAHVGHAADHLHVEVGVVVLLEGDGRDLGPCGEARALELRNERGDEPLVVHVRVRGRLGRGLGVRLDLDPRPRLELGHGDRAGELGGGGEVLVPGRQRNAVHLSLERRHRVHEAHVGLVLGAERHGPREALRRRPERRPRGSWGVLWECEGELDDAVVEVVLEADARPLDARLEGGEAGGDEDVDDALEVLAGLSWGSREDDVVRRLFQVAPDTARL